jgi:DNA-binding LacI/PurR family transcriptional regulator
VNVEEPTATEIGDDASFGVLARPPTLNEVAALAGVSRATASRALNGSPQVSPSARQAVQVAAVRLSYMPNPAARSLARRRSNLLAFVVSEETERFFADPFFSAVLRGAQEVTSANDLMLAFSVVRDRADRDRMVSLAANGHLDGVLLASVHAAEPLPARLREVGVPVVLSGRPLRRPERALYVDADNTGGARAATEELLRKGRRRLATITGRADMAVTEDRLAGFRAALVEHDLDADAAPQATGDFTVEGGRAATQQLLAHTPELDGIFAASDLMALGAVQAIVASGREIPGDVAVVGFDDVDAAAVCVPPLTTVRQPLDLMGREMARLLLAALAGTVAVEPVVLPTELVLRRST